MKPGDFVQLNANPNFSTKNRVDWLCEVVELTDEHGKPYLAVKDKLGVTWPLEESKVRAPDLGIHVSDETQTFEYLS